MEKVMLIPELEAQLLVERSDFARRINAFARRINAARVACSRMELERDALRKRVAELERAQQEEVAEFNAGYVAAIDGLPPDEPLDTKYDAWLQGYAWAKWPPRDKDARIAELERLLAMATRLEGTGWTAWRGFDGKWILDAFGPDIPHDYDTLDAALAAVKEPTS
jgi:hypothetical protein